MKKQKNKTQKNVKLDLKIFLKKQNNSSNYQLCIIATTYPCLQFFPTFSLYLSKKMDPGFWLGAAEKV